MPVCNRVTQVCGGCHWIFPPLVSLLDFRFAICAISDHFPQRQFHFPTTMAIGLKYDEEFISALFFRFVSSGNRSWHQMTFVVGVPKSSHRFYNFYDGNIIGRFYEREMSLQLTGLFYSGGRLFYSR